MKKKDLYAVLVILVLAASTLGIRWLSNRGGGDNEAYVSISYGGKKQEYRMTDKEQIISIDQGDNRINKVCISKDGVYMLESTCKNQLCVHQSKMTVDNISTRPTGRFIICLPHKLTVELKSKGADVK